MLRGILESIREILYPIFGDIVYEIGLKPFALTVFTVLAIIFVYLLYRFIQKSILQPIAANRRVLDQIAVTASDNRRLLQVLADERSPGSREGNG